MKQVFRYPFDANYLLRKKRSIRRELLLAPNLMEKRVAILGGSTTSEIKDMLELFLLHDGIKPVFYESEYNRYYEEILFAGDKLQEFSPEIIYIHTSNVNISRYPALKQTAAEIQELIVAEIGRFKDLWDRIAIDYACPVIQNNFELPQERSLGNLDAYDPRGRTHFINELNRHFSEQARVRGNLYLNDINYLSSWIGLERWYDKQTWHANKYAMSFDAIPPLAHNLTTIVRAIFGMSKKCLVLDLDNTLWGGVIGEEGLNGIQIGSGNAEAEAYSDFQSYLKGLKERGVLLAVCSKNEESNAREGFSHPDSVLTLDDFSDFRANWEPKHENLREIAKNLNIGIDSLVFADDNPVEREIVRVHEPAVAVPEMGSAVESFIRVIDRSGFFETVSLSNDDLQRHAFYADNAVRMDSQSRFDNYNDFLVSLEMFAEIKPIAPIYLDRVAQLSNKTNQFNLTTRRYSFAELCAICEDARYLTLYGRLQDKFGDNGLVSVMIGLIQGNELHVDLWLMSCRVLKRGMELAMLDCLVLSAKKKNVQFIVGHYVPTQKNKMVGGLFDELGFKNTTCEKDGSSSWVLDISQIYSEKNFFIKVEK